jgi:uncharacterized protein (UPF0276 family)
MTNHPTAGLGFKPQHFDQAITCPAAGLWFEVHAENYMVAGGPRLTMLDRLGEIFPLSLHGVGLSLAGVERPCSRQLSALARLVERTRPRLVSEHLAWSRRGRRCFPDLFPFPRSHEALAMVVRNIDIVQTALGQTILVENPSLYFDVGGHDWSETDFLVEAARRTGCGLLVDVNNIVVSANNLGFDSHDYVRAIPPSLVGEIHLAGHRPDPALGRALLIDSHDRAVSETTLSLFAYALRCFGPRPTLIERDGDIPAFDALVVERNLAHGMIRGGRGIPAVGAAGDRQLADA